MSEKKHELLLIAAALFISVVVLLYSVLDSPKYNNLEAVPIVAITSHTEKASDTPDKININTADVSELMELEGIGQRKAESIVEYREKNGRFLTVEEITNVNGIGAGIAEKNKDRITV